MDTITTLELTRDLVRDALGVYAIRVQGYHLTDMLVNNGDLLIVRRQTDFDDGDMVACKVDGQWTLRRLHRAGDQVRLSAETPGALDRYVHPDRLQAEGKVLAVLRHYDAVPALSTETEAL